MLNRRSHSFLGLWLMKLCALLVALMFAKPAHADRFDQLMADNNSGTKDRNQSRSRSANKGEVELNLERYQKLREQLADRGTTAVSPSGPRVVLGAARYDGNIRDGILELSGTLDVTLTGGGAQVIPVVGSSLILIDAKLNGKPIGLISRGGYHVWLSNIPGTHKITFRGLVAADGPRGSVEYAFGVARTPSTHINVGIMGRRVAPVVEHAVHSETIRGENSTTVKAALRPTTQIKLLGVHDFGGTQEREAKLFAETSSLLSVNDAQVELFTVIRYNILHAPAQHFSVDIPHGFEVVDAAGVGGFRYDVQAVDNKTRLIGRTSRPMRDRFELSLRLRKTRSVEDTLSLSPPRCVDVERQHGWLGVEVVGKLQLDVAKANELIDIDVRQLPAELVDSAVSPVLRAYRYIRDNPALELTARPLPELDLHNGNVDAVNATTVLAEDGTMVTELKLKLRNRLRPTLALTLADAATVRSVLLDGQPVKASRDNERRLILPLIRSAGGEHLKPFEVIVVWEEALPAMGLIGQRQLSLPAIDVEVASMLWRVYLPGGQHYSTAVTTIAPQQLWATASWHKPAHLRRAVRWSANKASAAGPSAVAGALPVRFKLPVTGVERRHQRFWVAAGEPVTLRVVQMRPWLWRMSAAACAALLAWLLARLPQLWRRRTHVQRRLELAATLLLAGVLVVVAWRLALPGTLGGSLVLAAMLMLRKRWNAKRWLRVMRVIYRRSPRALVRWLRKPQWTPRSRVRTGLVLAVTALLTTKFASSALELADNLLRIAQR